MRPVYIFQKVTKPILLVFLSFMLAQATAFAQIIGGIGAGLFLDTTEGFTMPRIMNLVPNSPAYKYLNATDFIMSVDGVSCKDKTIADVVSMIRGEAGTTVKITVADTKEGKHPRDYELTRVSIQTGAPTPPPDPLTAFSGDCEAQVKQLKRNGMSIIKTYTSECGNYFFNFNAEMAGTYHIRMMTMEEKKTGDSALSFSPGAKVFDGDNEPGAITIDKVTKRMAGDLLIAQVDGYLSFKKAGVGVINVQLHDDATKCKSMYVVIYK